MRILITMVFAGTVIITGLFGLNVETVAAQKVTVTLERQVGSGSWSTSDATINSGQQVKLRWNSTYANFGGCQAIRGSGFSTGSGNDVEGIDSSINEPRAGNSETYTVSCTGQSGVGSDSITITTGGEESASEPTVTLTRKYEGKWGTSDVSGDLRLGVAFRWSSTGADNCISLSLIHISEPTRPY